MIEEPGTELENENEEEQRVYFIDLNWYRDKERSFITLAESRLCSSSHTKSTFKSENAMLNTFIQCCSKREEFIKPNMPLLEMVFRSFLSNGNKPMDLDQLQTKLQHMLSESISPRDISVTKLKRMLDNDNYYGLQPVDTDI